jgi:DNA repair protein RecN (Recombination protein N)
MLKRISIANYALIDKLEVNLDDHLNVITGETGAGKSIVIDALTLILGQRGSRKNIRAGADKLAVQGVFEIDPQGSVAAKLSDMAIPLEGRTLILNRTLSQSGHNTCRINGFAVTVAQMKALTQDLIDIHSQHENNSLFQPSAQRRLLDAWGRDEIAPLLEKTKAQAARLKTLNRQIKEQVRDDRTLAREKQMLAFEIKDIEGAHLKPGEDESLEKEQRILENSEMLFSEVEAGRQLLNGQDEQSEGVLSELSQLQHAVERLSQFDEKFKPYKAALETAQAELSELSIELASYQEDIQFDAGRLDEVEKRLSLIDGLKRKYGDTLEDIIAYGQNLTKQYDDLAHHDDRLEAMKSEYAALWKAYRETARTLHEKRVEAARPLAQAIEKELSDLAMPRARFVIAVDEDEQVIAPWGNDQVAFKISVNPGTPIRPLKEVASGGEISRIMLAVKCIFGSLDHVETMIFDEIDTGISGRTAQVVAEKILALSRKRQVITITHLPQITAMADAHFRVMKSGDENSTQVSFEALDAEASRQELARMLSGARVTDLARTHAEEMLAMAAQQKLIDQAEAEKEVK